MFWDQEAFGVSLQARLRGGKFDKGEYGQDQVCHGLRSTLRHYILTVGKHISLPSGTVAFTIMMFSNLDLNCSPPRRSQAR